MRLNDPHMIEQTLKTTLPEVETIYWLIEDACYKGNSDKAKGMMSFLLYMAKYNPNLIKNGLRPTYRNRIHVLIHELFDNTSPQQRETILMKPAIESTKIPFQSELELKKYLVTHKSVLSEAFGENIKIWGVEVVVEGEYRCDIVAESKKTCYPIELKIGQGTHTVVSQCSKYCYYLYRRLRYGQFKDIQGVVVGNGFDDWSINELRREGHWIYYMRPKSNCDIILEQIH